jgi:hypothetical protein
MMVIATSFPSGSDNCLKPLECSIKGLPRWQPFPLSLPYILKYASGSSSALFH